MKALRSKALRSVPDAPTLAPRSSDVSLELDAGTLWSILEIASLAAGVMEEVKQGKLDRALSGVLGHAAGLAESLHDRLKARARAEGDHAAE